MKRLTFDLLLAGSLLVAPMAWAQTPGGSTPGNIQAPSGTTRSASPGQAPGTMVPDPGSPTQPLPPRNPGDPNPYPGSPTPTAPSPGTPAPRPSATDVPGVPPSASDVPAPARPDRPAGRTTAVPGSTGVEEADVTAAQQLHQANLKEVELARLGEDKATSAKVKSYARRLASDHLANDKQLTAWLDKKSTNRSNVGQASTGDRTGGASSTTGGAAPADTQDAVARLGALTGPEFDREFVNTMIGEHDKAIEMVRAAANTVTDRQLKSLLNTTLPKLEKHKKMAQELADKQLKG